MKDIAGSAAVTSAETFSTVADLKSWLTEQYPAMAGLARVMVAVNKVYAKDEHPLSESDKVAIIPPLSGG